VGERGKKSTKAISYVEDLNVNLFGMLQLRERQGGDARGERQTDFAGVDHVAGRCLGAEHFAVGPT